MLNDEMCIFGHFLASKFSTVYKLLCWEFQKLVFIIFGPDQRNLGGIVFLWNIQLYQSITKSVLILSE